FIPPGLHEFFYEGWAQVVEGKRKVLICTCEHTNGFLVPLELQFVERVEEDDGVFFQLRIADRSRSVEVGDELEAVRESYLLLAETTTDAILQIDHELKIVFANTAARRNFGYSKGELLHRSMAKLFPKSQYQRYLSRIEKYFMIDEDQREDSGMQNVIEVLAQRKSGEMLPMEISLGNS
ncbi:MAG: PAS domain S-box protein, partial [Pirellulales bacterium]|nr:PAS domain S-box protein [Pirellulales bacterium]